MPDTHREPDHFKYSAQGASIRTESFLASPDLEGRLVAALGSFVRDSQQAGAPADAVLDAIHFHLTLLLAHRAQFKLYTAANGRVLAGPFKGMRFPPPRVANELREILPVEGGCPNIAGLLLGTYEDELHESIETLLANRSYNAIVDVGCSIGYYAVGLAMRQPGAIVHARDTNPEALEHVRVMAQLNDVGERVVTGGAWQAADFHALPPGISLVFCDIEGAEKELLDPVASPRLSGCDIVVELHDVFDRTISTTVLERFSSTHDILLITNGSRRSPLPDETGCLTRHESAAVLADFRLGPTPWAVMRARMPATL